MHTLKERDDTNIRLAQHSYTQIFMNSTVHLNNVIVITDIYELTS